MDQIILTTFTDPMMGLSYECEPVYEQLAAHCQCQIEFKYVMSGLVRDVSDFIPEPLHTLLSLYRVSARECLQNNQPDLGRKVFRL